MRWLVRLLPLAKYLGVAVAALGIWWGGSHIVGDILDLYAQNQSLEDRQARDHETILTLEQERDEIAAALTRERELSKKHFREAVRVTNALKEAIAENESILNENKTLRDWYRTAIPVNELRH